MRTVLDRLAVDLPGDLLLTDPDTLPRYCRDEAPWAPHGNALAVARPRTAEDVRALVCRCIEYGVPVVGRGAGTGLSGGANAVDGCVIVSFERMDAIVEVDPVQQTAVVQPGVVNQALRDHCAERNLWYPPDPASAPWSTIGGNVATNAGGLCCVKYGVTRDYVLGMQVVTGTGALVRLGRRTAKGVAGYDLTALMVGSEGTLGLITEVTLKLRPPRPPERTVAGYFDSVVAAGTAVAAVAASGVIPSALELMDHRTLVAIDDWKNMGLSTEANVMLLARIDTPGDAETEAILAAFRIAGATWAAASTDEAEAEALFDARRLAYPALERLGSVLSEDVCVPKARVPEMLARVEATGRRHDTTIAIVAHAGDGNLHPALITPPGDGAARERAQLAFADIITDALELGGTVTGEHGVGLLKRDGLAQELSPDVLAMHHAVKAALDPHNILNPGKVIHAR